MKICINKTIKIILLVVCMQSLQSCSKKINFLTSSTVPAARGSVKVKKDKNNNYHIDVYLINLAEVNRLQPKRNVYVLWLITNEQATINIGRLNSSSNKMSGKLSASFNTVSSFKPVKIFITAEDDGEVQFPTGEQVITTENF
jgi:hypothetical protein